MKSSCCYSKVDAHNGAEGTSFYLCDTCEKPCDLFHIAPPQYSVGQKTIYLSEEGQTPEDNYYTVGVIMNLHGTKRKGWSYYVRDIETIYTLREHESTGVWVDEGDIILVDKS